MNEPYKTIVVIGGADKKNRALRLKGLAQKYGFRIVGHPISERTTIAAFYEREKEVWFGETTNIYALIDSGNHPSREIYFEENVNEDMVARFRGAKIQVEVREMTVAEVSAMVSKMTGEKVEVKIKE